MESKFRVVCEPGAYKCRCKGPWAETKEKAEAEAKKEGWFNDVQRHGHNGESINRWFCPSHAKKFGKKSSIEEKLKGQPLGKIFIKIGVLTEEKLTRCLNAQLAGLKQTAGRYQRQIGEILLEYGFVNKKQLEYALYIQQKQKQ